MFTQTPKPLLNLGHVGTDVGESEFVVLLYTLQLAKKIDKHKTNNSLHLSANVFLYHPTQRHSPG